MIHMVERRISLLVILFFLCLIPGYSTIIDTELHNLILNTEDALEPIISRGSILFSYSAPPHTQMVALAFEHEKYHRVYKYERNPHGVFIVTLPIPAGVSKLRYRVIVDGLWTVDPHTEIVSDSHSIPVSSIDIPITSSRPLPGVKKLPDGSTQFVYSGDTDSRVSLIGDFNRWDPFLIPMPESPVYPGIYSTTVNIPSTSLFYRFVVDGQEIVDPTNMMSSENGWGETASILPP